MAGPTVKEILVKFGIDVSSWKTSIQQLGKLLDDQNKKSAQANAGAAKAFESQIDSAEDLLTIVKKDTAEIVKQTALIDTLSTQHAALVDIGWDQVAIEKAITAEIQKQILLRQDSGAETVKHGKLTGGVTAKAAKTVFDQQGVIANSIKAVIIDLQGEVVKFLSMEKLVTKELQKQQSVVNSIKVQGAPARKAVPAAAVKALSKAPVAPALYETAIAQLNAKKVLGAISSADEAKERARILGILQQEILLKTQSTVHTKQEVAEIQKLSRLAKQFGGGGKPPGKPPGKGGGGGIFDNFFSFLGAGTEGEKAGKGGFVEGLFGGFASKMAGTIGFAILSAEGLGRVLEKVYEQLKDLILESDKFANVWNTFGNLTARVGAAPEEFMEQLKESTHGLVADSALASQANRVLMQGISISTEEINKLTRTVADLARVQGIDATQAQEEMNRALASGRLQSLAYSLGLEHAVREQLNLTSSLPESIRLTTEYAIVQEAAQKQLEKTGKPIETVGTSVSRANVAVKNFFETIAIKASETEGAKNLAKIFDDIAKSLENKDAIAGFASVVGKVMDAMAEWFKILQAGWELIKAAGGIFGALGDAIGTVASSAVVAANALHLINDQVSDKMQAKLTGYSTGWGALGTVIKNIGHALGEVAAAINQVSKIFNSLTGSLKALVHGDIIGALEIQLNYLRDLKTSVQDYFQSWYDGWFKVSKLPPPEMWVLNRPKSMEPPSAEKASALAGQDVSATETTDEGRLRSAEAELENFQYKLKLKKEEAELTKVIEEGKYQDIKAALEKEKTLYDELYKTGSVTLRQSVEENKKIRIEETAAEIKNLEQQKAAQISLANFEQKGLQVDLQRARLAEKVSAKGKAPEELKGDVDFESKRKNVKDLEGIEADQNRVRNTKALEIDNKIRAARQKLNLDLIKEDFKLGEDEIAARKSTVAALAKLDKDRLSQQTTALEYEFKEGAVSAEDYLATRVKLIEEEHQIEVQAAEDAFRLGEKNDATRAQRQEKLLEADTAREKTLTDLQLHELDIRTGAAEAASNRITSVLEAQLARQEEIAKVSPFTARKGEIEIIHSLIAADQERLKILRQQAQLQQGEPEQQAKTRVEIEKTEGSLQKYKEQLIDIGDTSKEIAGEARNLATAASLFPKGGKTAQGLEKYAQITETLGKLNENFLKRISAQKAGVSKPLTPEEVYLALKKSSDIAGDALQKLAESARDKVDAAVSTVRESLVDKFALALDSTTDVILRFRDSLVPKTSGETPSAATPASGAELGEKSLGTKAGGGPISATGPYTLHQGEYVLPTSMASVFNSFINAISTLTKAIEAKIGGTTTGLPKIGATTTGITLPQPFKLSGPATPASPGGTVTASDAGHAAAAEKSSTVPDASSSLVSLGGVTSSLSKGFKNLLDNTVGDNGLVGAFKNLGKNNQEAAKDLGNFTSGVAALAGSIGGIAQTFHTSGAFQGAMTGAASFGSAGGTIGTMIGGPIGGVIGQAIGSTVGAITGAISGAMRAATDRMAQRMVAAFQAIVQEVQTGNQTLGAGISLSIQQIQTTVSSLSGKKGGRDDLKQILPNMEQELQQLQQQQKQVLQAMDTQVSALNAPLAYQAQLQSVQQIITAYQQYIQAGGNVVTANQYLQDSFANLRTQGMQQMNQDEQDAVNNALNYNNLLLQRQELIQNTNQQIQDIMSQGVAVRQMPEGVTKARQIQQLMLNNTQQLDQLNQQISVSQYQLNVQQQIFGLATTRIGLENQLVILQNEQTNYSMQQIEALGNVLNQFGTKLPTSMQGALQQLGLGSAFVNPSTEPGLKPVPPVKTGISQIDLQNQLEYQQALSAWQLSQNFPIGYIPTSGNVGTTPIPTTIGTPGVYGANQGLPNSVWLTPGTTSILGTATSAATSLNTMGSAFGQLPGAMSSTMAGSLGIPSTLPSVPSLTINGMQVATVSTPGGQALLVSGYLGGETATTTQSGPGTTQQIGIVGTAAAIGSSTNSIFGALAGFPASAFPPSTTTSTAPISAPTSPIRSPIAATTNTVAEPVGVAPPTIAPLNAKSLAGQTANPLAAAAIVMSPVVKQGVDSYNSIASALAAGTDTAATAVTQLNALLQQLQGTLSTNKLGRAVLPLFQTQIQSSIAKLSGTASPTSPIVSPTGMMQPAPTAPVLTGNPSVDQQNQLQYQQAIAAAQPTPTATNTQLTPISGTKSVASGSSLTALAPLAGIALGPLGFIGGALAGIFGGAKGANADQSGKDATVAFNAIVQAFNSGQQTNTEAIANITALQESTLVKLQTQQKGGAVESQILPQMQAAINQLSGGQQAASANSAAFLQILNGMKGGDVAQQTLFGGPQTSLTQAQMQMVISDFQGKHQPDYIHKDVPALIAAMGPLQPAGVTTTAAPGSLQRIAPPEIPILTALKNAAGVITGFSEMIKGTTTSTAVLPSVDLGSLAPAKTPSPIGMPRINPAELTALTQQQQLLNQHITVSLQRVSAETQISQLSNSRVAAESVLVNMKMTEIQADMQRVQAHNDLLTRTQSISGGAGTTMEDLLQQTYETRGRQGFGRFYGETSNPA